MLENILLLSGLRIVNSDSKAGITNGAAIVLSSQIGHLYRNINGNISTVVIAPTSSKSIVDLR